MFQHLPITGNMRYKEAVKDDDNDDIVKEMTISTFRKCSIMDSELFQ